MLVRKEEEERDRRSAITGSRWGVTDHVTRQRCGRELRGGKKEGGCARVYMNRKELTGKRLGHKVKE